MATKRTFTRADEEPSKGKLVVEGNITQQGQHKLLITESTAICN